MYEDDPAHRLTELVPFDPENDSGYGTKVVEVNGEPTEIHVTNNLPNIFSDL